MTAPPERARAGEGILPPAPWPIGDIDKVPGLAGERVSLGQGEGEHAPVDAVGAVPLGGKLIADVGAAPSTRWQEAACSRAEPPPGLLAKITEPIWKAAGASDPCPSFSRTSWTWAGREPACRAVSRAWVSRARGT